LNDEAHRLSVLLSTTELGEFTELAASLLPPGDTTTLRKLARRLIEAQLKAVTAELKALPEELLKRPGDDRERPVELPRETPTASAVACLRLRVRASAAA
jgi:hypothetical protein